MQEAKKIRENVKALQTVQALKDSGNKVGFSFHYLNILRWKMLLLLHLVGLQYF